MYRVFEFVRTLSTRKRKRLLVIPIILIISALTAGTVLALVPPGAFGYETVCHAAGTNEQTTLILLPADAETHIAHGDPQVRCADPIPGFVYDPSVDLTKGYHVAEIRDNLYYVTDGSYQMMFLVSRKGVIVVDAPPSLGQNILNAIADVTDLPVTHVVYSHSHADHIGAAGIYPEDAVIIAHEDTAAQLEEAMEGERPYPYGIFVGGGPVPLPDKTFKSHYFLRVADQTLQLDYKGSNHEPGNIFVYAPQQKVLMLVDVIFPAWSPFARLALAENIPGYYKAHEQALAYDFDTFVGGHLTRLGTRADIMVQQAYVQDIQQNAATALMQVDFFAIAQETGFENLWLLFDTYLTEVAQTCSELTLEEWRGQLAGADIFTYDHCWAAAESLRID